MNGWLKKVKSRKIVSSRVGTTESVTNSSSTSIQSITEPCELIRWYHTMEEEVKNTGEKLNYN